MSPVADAFTGEPVDALQVKAPASLFRSEAGRTVFAMQRDAGAI